MMVYFCHVTACVETLQAAVILNIYIFYYSIFCVATLSLILNTLYTPGLFSVLFYSKFTPLYVITSNDFQLADYFAGDVYFLCSFGSRTFSQSHTDISAVLLCIYIALCCGVFMPSVL